MDKMSNIVKRGFQPLFFKGVDECRKDVLKNCDYEWGEIDITRIVNCPTLSVAEAAEAEREEGA